MKLIKTPDRIGSMFNRIAPVYDFLNHFLSVGFDIYWRSQATKALVSELKCKPAMVADVASGTGDLALSLMKRETWLFVVGIDIAEKMLKKGKQKLQKEGYDNRFLPVLGDALNLPLSGSSCDAIMIAYGIRNVLNVEKALEEFARVLKPGGLLLILEFSLPKAKLFRDVYLFYFKKILPTLGRLVSGDIDAYSYLPTSVTAFMTVEDMEMMLQNAGFKVMETRCFLSGVSYYILGKYKGR
ncbi:MAG TPA: bifunctional demethylmenaquinone methyltransferase/2-methoxy-6-polyprenyl-1,4-benzoquinol methylase UbiE [Thermodesulforhabdus norvegica]|uniref:Demethylmenaquinone methyltransferase n=1 Tax=Thermodesulforhabdus norvegica TaxID=39841 RepID=A0A7C0WVM9_9BACT|nr:bifunctional demethylmenaquinone methyltransferase/2-methoxy-6-polyprenyl-1,4-benzoquinol methylase UbiE [Thermodesulforhabdus norvegica]